MGAGGGAGGGEDDRHRASKRSWRGWLAGRTLRARLISGLLALFTLASIGVGAITVIALKGLLLNQLDQQVTTSSSTFSISIEHASGPPSGPGGNPPGGSPGTIGTGATGPGGPPPSGPPPSGSAPTGTAPSGAGPGGTNAGNPCSGTGQNPLASGQSVGTFAARFKAGRLTYACVVTRSGGLSSVRLPAAAIASLERLPANNHPVTRYLSGLGDYRLTAFAGQDDDVHIAGLPLTGVEAIVAELELIETIVFGTALVVMGIAGFGWIRLALRPLDRIAATATQVSDLPLGSGEVALPHRVPGADSRTEVGGLARALNLMLGHVEASLSERQASEAQLRQFIADASHELRTPLAGIRGYTELALRVSDGLEPQARTALRRIDSQSARMSRLVDDLLLLARLDAGRPLAHEPVDLTRLAIDATSDARVAAPAHAWVLDLPSEPVVITGDEHRLHQVLANLLTNARTHTPPGTTVTVRLTRAAGGVELSITDDGPGIPAVIQDHVWERFARGDSSRSRETGSTGLGLAIVRAVVTAHQGRLRLESIPGYTTFCLWLPAAGA
jgi:two-component system, OmpR family, sensor kinase